MWKFEVLTIFDILLQKNFKTDHEKAMNTYITNVSSLKNFSQNERKKKKTKRKKLGLFHTTTKSDLPSRIGFQDLRMLGIEM